MIAIRWIHIWPFWWKRAKFIFKLAWLGSELAQVVMLRRGMLYTSTKLTCRCKYAFLKILILLDFVHFCAFSFILFLLFLLQFFSLNFFLFNNLPIIILLSHSADLLLFPFGILVRIEFLIMSFLQVRLTLTHMQIAFSILIPHALLELPIFDKPFTSWLALASVDALSGFLLQCGLSTLFRILYFVLLT